MDDGAPVSFPGVVPPARAYDVDAMGVRITVHEWGATDDPPLVLVHGGFDFARTFDEFAPRLVNAGWRVIAWDHRGHGDSGRAHLYSWDADLRDAAIVLDTVVGRRPVAAIGHSKGGALLLQLADAHPFRFSKMVNIDGMPYRRKLPDVAEHERTKMQSTELTGWLAHRAASADAERKPGTLDDLARRRGRMNPRLAPEWLRYLVTVGAFESDDGWRWKIDPSMRMGGFGPWRPEWTLLRLPGLAMPFLAILAGQPEPMGWGTEPHEVLPFLPLGGRCEIFEDSGHFVHIEQSERVAELVLDFLGAPR